MSEENKHLFTEQEIKDMKDGKVNLAGFNIDLSKILGKKVAENFYL